MFFDLLNNVLHITELKLKVQLQIFNPLCIVTVLLVYVNEPCLLVLHATRTEKFTFICQQKSFLQLQGFRENYRLYFRIFVSPPKDCRIDRGLLTE